MRTLLVEAKVKEILAANQDLVLPIDIETVARRRGINVLPHSFEDSISGMLIVKNGTATIAYNESHPPVRTRFTIAHELGHYELHRKGSTLFLDKEVLLRSQYAPENEATQKMEQEANAFAAALLMPKTFIDQEVYIPGVDLHDEESLKTLAKRFGVSSLAMYYRLSKLSLV